jgi:GNAT superfamily N-acetyltransferase
VTAPFSLEVLAPHHARAGFCSNAEPLDRYFHQVVTQDVRRRASSCYVAIDPETGRVAGYYTLSAGGVPLTDMPQALVRKLPRYPHIPVARLGRLAVDLAYRGRQIGASLLWDAALRAARSEVSVVALMVDAKDVQAEAFYLHHGFSRLSGKTRQLVMPLANVA